MGCNCKSNSTSISSCACAAIHIDDVISRLSWQAFEKNHAPLSQPNRRKLSSARSSLKTRISKHNTLAAELLGPQDANLVRSGIDPLANAGVVFRDLTRTGEWEADSGRQRTREAEPEYYGIDLPSSRSIQLNTEALAQAGAYEIVLRVAWMAHLLHEICLSLVVQAEIFRRTIKRTPGSRPMTQREKTLTSLNMREQYQAVRVYARQYMTFRERMVQVDAVPAFEAAHPEYAADAVISRAALYQELKPDHIRCDTKAYDTLGPGTFSLPWFWKLTARKQDIADENFVQDCAFLAAQIDPTLTFNYRSSVFRVRWINARAGLDRANEEIRVLRAEMRMIHKGYGSMANDWAKRAQLMEDVEGGEAHVMTAWAKEEVWREHSQRAKQEFNRILPGIIV